MKKIFFIVFALLNMMIVNGQITMLHYFTGTDGKSPGGGLSTFNGSTFYGMTESGGVNNDGVIFSINANGSNFTKLLDFNGTNGDSPQEGNLIFSVSGDTLFGMTFSGGANGDGNIFSIHIDGSGYTDLLDFNFSNGGYPYGSLTLSGNILYGMTADGGDVYGDGNIFSIHTDGSGYTDLHDFNGTDGNEPFGDLIISASTLYGMTQWGGVNGDGNIFSIHTDGSSYTDLHDFTGADGAQPYANLTLLGNILYGTTSAGGVYNNGDIFSINTNGSGYTILHSFIGNDGSSPVCTLTPSGSGLLYGTAGGGTYNWGVLFSINTNGSGYTDLYNFNLPSIAANPGCFVVDSKNTLYGTVMNTKAPYYDGGVYTFTPPAPPASKYNCH